MIMYQVRYECYDDDEEMYVEKSNICFTTIKNAYLYMSKCATEECNDLNAGLETPIYSVWYNYEGGESGVMVMKRTKEGIKALTLYFCKAVNVKFVKGKGN